MVEAQTPGAQPQAPAKTASTTHWAYRQEVLFLVDRLLVTIGFLGFSAYLIPILLKYGGKDPLASIIIGAISTGLGLVLQAWFASSFAKGSSSTKPGGPTSG